MYKFFNSISKPTPEESKPPKPEEDNTEPKKVADGAFYALCAKGAQDAYMFDDPKDNKLNAGAWDARKLLLKKRHIVVYRELDYTTLTSDGTTRKFIPSDEPLSTQTFTLKKECDLVNMIDLVVYDPNSEGLGMFKSIETEIGGQRIDKWGGDDFPTLAETACAIFKRKISRKGSYLFLPLALAPFHEENLLPLIALQYHDVKITIRFSDAQFDRTRLSLYGNVYFLETEMRRDLALESLSFMVTQTQFSSSGPFYFNHPVGMMYFWGFDKDDVSNVSLTFDGAAFYDGPIQPLERQKELRGLGLIAPTFIFFSQTSLDKPFHSSVNFSRIYKAILTVTTRSGRVIEDVKTAGINAQPLLFSSGMAGLAFSK